MTGAGTEINQYENCRSWLVPIGLFFYKGAGPMGENAFVSTDDVRLAFSMAMSDMYKAEVPAYGTLMSLVASVNRTVLETDSELRGRLEKTDSLNRISQERHGAIRLGTAEELATMRRVFAVMGMFPVGYYDLSEAGVPVHSTSFRPIGDAALKRNPFRVFTSLLRLDLIADIDLRGEAQRVLSERRIFTEKVLALTCKAEHDGGLSKEDVASFVEELLETFRWHDKASIDIDLYHRLHDAHRLIADVVSFKGPHINHLTPRTLDIDAVQVKMPEWGITPKAVVEGPPPRRCPILLRQTSFKALEERVSFRNGSGGWSSGLHTARFGEVEQRGVALTPKGRKLYDLLLNKVRERVLPEASGSNSAEYEDCLSEVFVAFPDDWNTIRKEGLGYFSYSLTTPKTGSVPEDDLEALIEAGIVQFDPIVYEDFLPVSAAGIFQSNLGDGAAQSFTAIPSQKMFEVELGCAVLDEFNHYAAIEKASVAECLRLLKGSS